MLMKTVKTVTPAGEIIGKVTGYGALYRGVKYATAERFSLPREITSYDGEVNAVEQGVCCPQMRAFWNEEHRFYYKEFRKGKTFKYSEDCLILDLYQPSNAKDCPVVVFIHGGSFTGGSINEMQFDGSAYAKRGVIFIAINYRLNVFGFFADGKHSNGNLGLFDQYAAIEWIRHNVASFGGNPDKITLMGQSAGAMSVQTLICSPLLKGKINGAIMLSGGGKRTAMLPLSKPNTRYWNSLVELSGAKDFDEFKSMPAEKVWTTWKTKKVVGKAMNTKAVIDGTLVTDDKYETTVPIIYGVVKKDMVPPVLRHMARSFARKQLKKGADCYVFEFDRLLPPDEASFHSCDLWYALGSLGNSPRPFTAEDYALSDEMVDRFSAFAGGDAPNAQGKSEWKTYRSKKDIFVFR